MKTNVTIVIYGIDRAVSHEWTVDYIDQERFRLSFVLMTDSDSEMERFLADRKVPYIRVRYTSKKDLPAAVWKIFRFLKNQGTDVVHTHLMEANLAGLTAARLAGVRNRLYTRHHSTIHHVYFPSAIRYDRWVNSMATGIIAISPVVYDVLVKKEAVPPAKVHLVPHGFRFEELLQPDEQKVVKLRQKYGIGDRAPVVGVIARYTDWKGIQYIIPAFKRLLARYPGALLVLANAKGDYAAEIKGMLRDLEPDRYVEIAFEPDFVSLYRLFDIYVHTPIDDHSEAFGQTYVEALVSGVPSVFTLSGIATGFIVDGQNALVVEHKNAEEIYEAMLTLLGDRELGARLAARGRADALERFPLEKMIHSFEQLYSKKTR